MYYPQKFYYVFTYSRVPLDFNPISKDRLGTNTNCTYLLDRPGWRTFLVYLSKPHNVGHQTTRWSCRSWLPFRHCRRSSPDCRESEWRGQTCLPSSEHHFDFLHSRTAQFSATDTAKQKQIQKDTKILKVIYRSLFITNQWIKTQNKKNSKPKYE